jgi:trichodiene synthase
MFPKALVTDEEAAFADITSAVMLTEPISAFVNDLFFLYKELLSPEAGIPTDRKNLVTNFCHVEGLSIQEGFDRVAADATRGVQKAQEVFDGTHDPTVEEAMHGFIRGYIRWHTCDRALSYEGVVRSESRLGNWCPVPRIL